MKKIWNLFDNLNDIVYVSDVDTYNMIYLNKAGLKAYGLDDISQIAGCKCYELLQRSSTPCAMCTNARLEEGRFVEWHHYNPLLDCHLKLIDTMIVDEGRRCRLELAITKGASNAQIISPATLLEKIANEAFHEAMRTMSPERSLNVLLEYLGKAFRADRIYIFEKNEDGTDSNTYEWCAEGVQAEIDNLQCVPKQICKCWYDAFEQRDTVIIRDLEHIRLSDPDLYDTLKPQGIRTLVVGALENDGKIVGFYGFDNPPNDLLDSCSSVLQITGHFASALLKIRNLFRDMKHMSFHDQLTELGNRYALAATIDQIGPDQELGVIFCDVTGLKQVNDTLGHAAGDKLLVRTAKALRDEFPDSEIFRIGGDEMVLILTSKLDDSSEEEQLATLRTRMKRHDINVAVGLAWRKSPDTSFDDLLEEAERSMYADKEEYYRVAEHNRRRSVIDA